MVPDFAFNAFKKEDLEMLRQINLCINIDLNGKESGKTGSLTDITRQTTELIKILEKPETKFEMYTKQSMIETINKIEKDMTRLHVLLGQLRDKLGGK